PHAPIAREALDRALAQLGAVGAPREVGLAYLNMASVAALQGDSAPASWLAKAQPLIARAGTAKDYQRLRRAFRTHGRREIDRVLDADIASAIDRSRETGARLRDVLSAERDARELRTATATPGDKLLDETLESLRGSVEELIL